ncbi:type II toxin-antitoxin system VapC family toxin [Occultella kanbiaonis]|uniref:type II toxin-antitoxin system VapC family toxin n=1 Tax=Occultella kanbiaonis TaxID=2675754 RepID=UPI0012B769BD|nr:type II toxin-antitoxin system VapC family toxin [Occultella kanbiaonis]
MTVVDASIVVRLLQNRRGDSALRDQFGRQRHVYAPTLVDAEVTSAIRGLLLTSKPSIRISPYRAEQMLDDFADLPLIRYPMQPYQRRALALRDTFTAYEAFYLALAESLGMPLLTDDRKFARAPAQTTPIETWS